MSTLKADTIQNTSGGAATLTKQSAAKAWVNFDGTGTIAARDSFNVSSLDDDGTGNYGVNFSSSFSDGNYSATSTTSGGGAVCVPYDDYTQTASTYTIGVRRIDTTAMFDASRIHYGMNGDLA